MRRVWLAWVRGASRRGRTWLMKLWAVWGEQSAICMVWSHTCVRETLPGGAAICSLALIINQHNQKLNLLVSPLKSLQTSQSISQYLSLSPSLSFHLICRAVRIISLIVCLEYCVWVLAVAVPLLQSNIIMKGKQGKKEVRKPISINFSPKRLAINFDPPTLSNCPSTQFWNTWRSTLASSTITRCD